MGYDHEPLSKPIVERDFSVADRALSVIASLTHIFAYSIPEIKNTRTSVESFLTWDTDFAIKVNPEGNTVFSKQCAVKIPNEQFPLIIESVAIFSPTGEILENYITDHTQSRKVALPPLRWALTPNQPRRQTGRPKHFTPRRKQSQ